MEAFEHVLGRYVKQERDDHTLIACLIAWATNMGLGRMGEISDIGYRRWPRPRRTFSGWKR